MLVSASKKTRRFTALSAALGIGVILGGYPQLALGQGFPNVPQTPGALVSQTSNLTLLNPDALVRNPDVPTNEGGLLERMLGRTAIIAWFNGWLYTVPENSSSAAGSDLRSREWNIADLDEITLSYISVPDGTGPVASHGYVQRGDLIDLGFNRRFRATSPGVNVLDNAAPFPPNTARDFVYWPFTMSTYWSYSSIDFPAVFGFDGVDVAQWDHLGSTGVVGHPLIIGDRLIMASDQTRTGVAAYDLGPWMDPDVLSGASPAVAPQLLDVLTNGGPGGYWAELYGADGQLFAVFPYRTNGEGIRVVDVTGVVDPDGSGQMEFVADIPIPGSAPMYLQFQDHFAFSGSHKVDMRTFESVLQLDLNGAAPGFGTGLGAGEIDTSQFALPIGNLLACGGSGPNQGLSIWAHAADPDTTAPSVGYHVPQAGRTNYPLRAPVSILIHETLESWTIVNGDTFAVSPLDGPNAGIPVPGEIQWTFNDMLQFTPDDPWEPNRSYEVQIRDSTAGDPNLTGIMDAAGNVMDPYSFTFSTGSVAGGNAAPSVDLFTVSDHPALPLASVTFDVSASDPDPGDTLEYRFDFGDGSPRTAWGAATQVMHAYDVSGHYKALVQVRDDSGLIATQIRVVTVTDYVPGAAQPTKSSPIAGDPAADRLWVVNPDNDTVTAIDTVTMTVEFETPVCTDPRSVAIDQAGSAWVTCHDADMVDVVSPAGTVTTSIALEYGDAPLGIVLAPDGSFAWVSLMGSGEIARIDTTTQAITRYPLGPTPRALALTGDGSLLYVTRFISPLNHGEVWEFDTASTSVVRTLLVPKFGSIANRDTTASGFGVANYLTGVSLSPAEDRLLLAANKMNTDRGTLSGPDLDQDNSVRNIVALVDLASGGVEAVDIDNSDSSHAVGWSPLGDYFFAALQGNNEIAVFDAFEVELQEGLGGMVARLGVGLAPQGLWLDAASGRMFVKNFLDRTVSTLEFDSLFESGSLAVGTEPDLGTVALEQLPADVLLGKQIFYNASDPRMSAEGYISCATCHLDGGHDGRVWDFTGRGEGLRNTVTLRGRAGTGHGPVHWSSNFDEIQDFEHDIRGAFGGTGFLPLTPADFSAEHPTPVSGPMKAGENADLDALATYVASLDDATIPRSPHRAADGSLTAAGSAGATVFDSLGCNQCHAGSTLTDNVRHDVGTLRSTSGGRLGIVLDGIDTPTLRGLWNTAPYFHDGSAPSLSDVFEVAAGVVIQGEAGTVSGNAQVETGVISIANNYDNIPRADGFVDLNASGGTASVAFASVEGGSGGIGALEVRFTNNLLFFQTHDLIIRITNGAGVSEHTVTFPPAQNLPSWFNRSWISHRIEGLSFTAGTTNTIEIETAAGDTATRILIDEIVVSTADHLAAANIHRQVSALAQPDADDLLAYLLQIDGSPLPAPGPAPYPGINVELPPGGQVILDPLVSMFVEFNVDVTGFDLGDLLIGGTSAPQATNLVELIAGRRYRVDITGMQSTGTVTLAVVADAAEDALGRTTSATSTYSVLWRTDDLAPLSDEFDDAATLAQWERRHLVEGWNAEKLSTVDIDTSAADHLRLVPTPSASFQDNVAAMLFKSITGDFVVTTHFDARAADGSATRPGSRHSLAGLMIRAPRAISAAAPNPPAPPSPRLDYPSGTYSTDWTPGEEDFLTFTFGMGGLEMESGTPANQWHFGVMSTDDSDSELYQDFRGVPLGVNVATLQIIRRGDTFLFLRKHGDDPWIIEDRQVRPDLPETLQVAVTAVTDYWGLLAYNAANQNDIPGAYHQNRNVFTDANGFPGLDPDLQADFDYVRFRLPPSAVTEAMLGAVAYTSDSTSVELLGDSILASHLGDPVNLPYDPSTTTTTTTTSSTSTTTTSTSTTSTSTSLTTTSTTTSTTVPVTDVLVGYRSKAPRADGNGTPVNNTLDTGWIVTLDDQILFGDIDDPENFELGREAQALVSAQADAQTAPANEDGHYVSYRMRTGRESVQPAGESGRFPRPESHIERHWELVNNLGDVRVESRGVDSMMVPAGVFPGGPGAVAPIGRTHYACYDVKVTSDVTAQTPESAPGSGAGKFSRGLQIYVRDLLGDCTLDRAGFASFAGTAVEGSCLLDLKSPVQLCNPVEMSPVEPPRLTSAVIDPVFPTTTDSLLCYPAKRAKRYVSADAAALADAVQGAKLVPGQTKHGKRRVADGSALHTAPASLFPAPILLETRKREVVCLPTEVLSVLSLP